MNKSTKSINHFITVIGGIAAAKIIIAKCILLKKGDAFCNFFFSPRPGFTPDKPVNGKKIPNKIMFFSSFNEFVL